MIEQRWSLETKSSKAAGDRAGEATRAKIYCLSLRNAFAQTFRLPDSNNSLYRCRSLQTKPAERCMTVACFCYALLHESDSDNSSGGQHSSAHEKAKPFSRGNISADMACNTARRTKTICTRFVDATQDSSRRPPGSLESTRRDRLRRTRDTR